MALRVENCRQTRKPTWPSFNLFALLVLKFAPLTGCGQGKEYDAASFTAGKFSQTFRNSVAHVRATFCVYISIMLNVCVCVWVSFYNWQFYQGGDLIVLLFASGKCWELFSVRNVHTVPSSLSSSKGRSSTHKPRIKERKHNLTSHFLLHLISFAFHSFKHFIPFSILLNL